MKVKLLDGAIKEFSAPKTVEQIASEIALSLGKSVVGAKINQNQFVPKDFLVTKDLELEFITKKENWEAVLNQTAAFISLVALKKEFPRAQLVDFGYNQNEMEFNATFNLDPRMKLEALPQIQKQVNQLLKEKITCSFVDLPTVKKELTNNPYQWEIAESEYAKNQVLCLYELAGVKMVSANLVLTENHQIQNLELQQLTGSYWKDDAKNIMLQRIHGMFGKKLSELNEKKAIMTERRSRDHRAINQQLEIFGFDPLVGPGLPLWLPNGSILKAEIEKYLKVKEWEYDYIQVETPVIGTVDLYKKSGHWDHYREDMFQPFKGGQQNDEEFVLRPMNCPHHVAIYKQKLHSYRELPIRLAEHAVQHRYESSGSLTGLERVRAMQLTDSHIFVRPDQVESEFKAIYKLIAEVLQTFQIEIDYLSFSVRDPEDKEKYFQDDEMWNNAENELEKVLKDLDLKYKKMVGEAAFYGPKLDIQIKTAQSHEITVSTIQLDFLMPMKFDVTYIDANQELKHPIMIHRGLIGTYERFIATLMEQTKGVLPLWLSPTQIEILPVSGDEEILEYAEKIHQEMKKTFVRSHVDLRDERLAWKIREAQIHKIPYQLVIGQQEVKKQTVTYREYGQEKTFTLPLKDFATKILGQIQAKK